MFKLIKQKEIKNLELELFEFEHEKTKARHIHLKADDMENGFICGFKTLPDSNNGVMHILEHSVFQGSKDFPLKDPFTSLTKNSLQTYMNASTATDHTYYPFATQNKKDFFNLMHVYTNAIFFPLLKKEAFLQEGWRYEFSDPKDSSTELKVNGVVFNEMIGIMDSPYSHLWKNFFKVLYPDTKYAHNSGGSPLHIPELSYEEFCDFHKNYYHPSNAIFLTYGDIDYSEIQEKLEEYALKNFEHSEFNIQHPIQPHFTKPRSSVVEYPYKNQDFAEKHFFVKLWNITDITKTQESFTIEFLNSLLAGDSSSVMQKALTDSKLAVSPFCYSADNGRDIFLVIGGEGVKKENFDKLDTVITETLHKIVKDGFKQEHIEKEIHQFELSQKSKTTGRTTYGLNILSVVLGGVIHGVSSEKFLESEIALEKLKEDAKDKSFFTNFIQEKIINNSHQTNFIMKASPEAAKKEEQNLANLAKAKEATLTKQDREQILADSKALEFYQSETDKEDILPEFSIADIPLDYSIQELEKKEFKGKTIYAFKAPTSGLTYFSRHGFIEGLKASDSKYLSIYRTLASSLGYADKTYEEAIEYASSICSGVGFSVSFTEDRFDSTKIYTKIAFGSKMLAKNTQKVKELIDDMVTKPRFDEKDRIIHELKLSNNFLQNSLPQSGHTIAIEIAKAQLSEIDNLSNYYDGIEYANFLKDLIEKLDNEEVYDHLISKLKNIHEKIEAAYSKSALSIVDLEDNLDKSIEICYDDNVVSNPTRYALEYDLNDYNINIVESDKVTANYCSMVMPAPYFDNELSGAFFVLSRIINNDFTHIEIREKGGAYGGFAGYRAQSEVFILASYMDPNISATFEIFKNLKNWLGDGSKITQEQIEEGILQAIAANDSPVLKIKKCSNALSRFFDDVTDQDLLNFREMILKTDATQIKRVINELILPKLDMAVFSAFVNKSQYQKEGLDFNTIEF